MWTTRDLNHRCVHGLVETSEMTKVHSRKTNQQNEQIQHRKQFTWHGVQTIARLVQKTSIAQTLFLPPRFMFRSLTVHMCRCLGLGSEFRVRVQGHSEVLGTARNQTPFFRTGTDWILRFIDATVMEGGEGRQNFSAYVLWHLQFRV